MKNVSVFLSLCLMIGLMSCSRSFVKSDYDREVDFANYKTYDWMAQPQKSSSDPLAQNTLLEKRIKNAVEKELTAMGYQKQTTGKPDFLIVYYIGVEDKLDVTSYGYGYWRRYHGAGGVDVRQYKEGTLILDIIDPKLDQLVWRGWYVDAVDDREIGMEKIRKAIQHVLEEFPPQ